MIIEKLPGYDLEPRYATDGSGGIDFPLCLTRPGYVIGTRGQKSLFIADQNRGFAERYYLIGEDQENWVNHGKLPYDLLQTRKDDLWVSIYDFEPLMLSLGVKVQLEQDEVMYLHIRSSAALNGFYLYNSVGVIDSDYRGELFAMIASKDEFMRKLWHGEVLVQGVVNKISRNIEFGTVNETSRGDGGFGSTNK